jgi:uncharacterized protein (TIGR03790 family)
VLIVNESSAESVEIANYYAAKRGIPTENVCRVKTRPAEEIHRQVYEREIAAPVMECLKVPRLAAKARYLVTTLGVPLRIMGSGGPDADIAAVDSELCLLYGRLRGIVYDVPGPFPNPIFQKRNSTYSPAGDEIYLVTRLAAYSVESVKAMIDRSLAARDEGRVVLDLKSSDDQPGNSWLRTAAILIPPDRLVMDETPEALYDQSGVIGYGGWGSNDQHRKRRHLGFEWLPGAIATEYVSTNGRTFERPPEDWEFGSWENKETFFGGSPQSLSADLIEEGATGVSGHVWEPYLAATPRPEYLFPAYLGGRNLAESFYIAIPYLSWMNVVIGDPLCSLY